MKRPVQSCKNVFISNKSCTLRIVYVYVVLSLFLVLSASLVVTVRWYRTVCGSYVNVSIFTRVLSCTSTDVPAR